MDNDQQRLYDLQKATDDAWKCQADAFKVLKEEHENRTHVYHAKIGMLREQHEKLNSAYEELKRQQRKEQTTNDDGQNVSHNVRDDDVLKINVNEKIISVQRGVLTQIKGSRLESLFGGRWDQKLRRKKDGLIFLDVNYDSFNIIVEYLKKLRTAPPNNPPRYMVPSNENNKVFLERLCRLFGLKNPGPCPTIDDSSILNNLEGTHANSLLKFLEEDNVHGNLELIYKASRDGWGSCDFHSKCDNKGPTVTIIQSSGGYVFGGFADKPWSTSRGYRTSAKAFLFALKCYSGLGPTKMKLKSGSNPQFAVWHYSGHGPSFGGGHDICVSGNASSDNSSYTNVGITYECPSGQSGSQFLTGSKKFQVAEVEVFSVVPLKKSDVNLPKDVVNNDVPLTKSEPWQTMIFEEFPQGLKETMYTEQKELIASWDRFLASETKFQEEKALVNFLTTGFVTGIGEFCKDKRRMHDTEEVQELSRNVADHEQEIKNHLVCEWTCQEVAMWVKRVKGLSEEVSEILEEHKITGAELLALEQEHLKDLGITRPGTLAVIFKAIQSVRHE